MKRLLNVIIFTFLFLQIGLSNNLRITKSQNPLLGKRDISTHSRLIQFNISWENSWRKDLPGQLNGEPNNYDATWIFIKYKIAPDGEWQHATLSTVQNDHSYPNDATISTVSDGKGVFIFQKDNSMARKVDFQDIKIRWNYGADGLTDIDEVAVKVFGIEMVYIPQGSFYVGDSAASSVSLKSGSKDKSPWYITSEDAIIITNTSSGGHYYVAYGWDGEDTTGSSFTIPSSFPKGYKAIYCMKYEITQGEYAIFLNLLNSSQARNRYPKENGNYRHTISYSGDKYIAYRSDRACNFLSWSDGSAYADWSGLRPFTELEHEKICRGPKLPVPREFAWGSINETRATTISGEEDGTERITNSGANCSYNGVLKSLFSGGDAGLGPLRVGIYATVSSNREESGASYYGVMEMSGNLWENCITVGNQTGRSFNGSNGDGQLNNKGTCDVYSWPGENAIGAGFCGGDWFNVIGFMTVSQRIDVANSYYNRSSYFGFRCVRTAP